MKFNDSCPEDGEAQWKVVAEDQRGPARLPPLGPGDLNSKLRVVAV